MRERIAATAAALTLATVLLLNFKGPADGTLGVSIKPLSTATSTGSGDSGGSASASPSPAATSSDADSTATSSPASSGGSTSTAGGTFAGPVASNPYGDVQVRVTIQNGKITDVQALSLPSGGHSGRISDYVAPILRSRPSRPSRPASMASRAQRTRVRPTSSRSRARSTRPASDQDSHD